MINGALTSARLKGALRPSSAPLFTWFTNPPGSTDTTPKQSGRLFLPQDKNPSSEASVHWRQLDFFPLPFTVSGFQDSRVIRIWHRWNCWIQHGTLYPFENRGIIRCSSFKTNQKTNGFKNGLQTPHFCPCGLHDYFFFGGSGSIYNHIALHFHIGLLIYSKVLHQISLQHA